MTWVLILYVWANGPALTNVPGFKSEAECNSEGHKTKQSGAADRFVCVPQTR